MNESSGLKQKIDWSRHNIYQERYLENHVEELKKDLQWENFIFENRVSIWKWLE